MLQAEASHIFVVATHAYLRRDLFKQFHMSRTPLTEFSQSRMDIPASTWLYTSLSGMSIHVYRTCSVVFNLSPSVVSLMITRSLHPGAYYEMSNSTTHFLVSVLSADPWYGVEGEPFVDTVRPTDSASLFITHCCF